MMLTGQNYQEPEQQQNWGLPQVTPMAMLFLMSGFFGTTHTWQTLQ
jgi:hypothetical protein